MLRLSALCPAPRTSEAWYRLRCNAITHPISPPFSLVAGLTCYTCVNVSDNQVSTSPLNALPSLLRVRNACIVSGPTAISFKLVRSAIDPFYFIFKLPPPTPLVPPTNLHSLSRPCRKGITDIGSTSGGEGARQGEEEASPPRINPLSISLNRGSADGNLYRKSLIRNRVDGQHRVRRPTGIHPSFIPSIPFPFLQFLLPIFDSSARNFINTRVTFHDFTRRTFDRRSNEYNPLPLFPPLNFVSIRGHPLSRCSIGENRQTPSSYFFLPSSPPDNESTIGKLSKVWTSDRSARH